MKPTRQRARQVGTAGIARQQWRARIETQHSSIKRKRRSGIARQQWRARIETICWACLPSQKLASPASNGGRGLKPASPPTNPTTRAASPASNGGRGLKHPQGRRPFERHKGIARQQWRARIETALASRPNAKHKSIARQQWRARIETIKRFCTSKNTTRIARQQWRARIETST